MLRFFNLRITDRREETGSAISLAFDVPMRWRQHFRFLPGQYVTLRVRIGTRDVRRAYSICSGTQDGELRVAIKRVPGGLFSNHACDHLAAGQMLDVMPAHGSFTPSSDGKPSHHYVGCASGSGITPVLSILKTVLQTEPESRFTLFYGNRSRADCLFGDTLDGLQARYPTRFVLAYVFSREPAGDHEGRIESHLDALIARHVMAPDVVDRWFICGPEPMMRAASDVLTTMGVPEARIATERFGAASDADVVIEGVDPEAVVTARVFGRTIDIRPGTATIATAAREAGIDLPYSCGIGVCALCKARIVEGQAHMPDDTILTQADRDAGFILTCRSRAMSARLVLDCDVD